MPHLHRFFVESGTEPGASCPLPREEAHHAFHVVRVRVGDEVELFDGRGHAWTARVTEATRRDVSVSVESERTEDPPKARLTLLQAWLNREKTVDELVRRATEVGVDRFVFFRSGHSDRDVKRVDKLERAAIEVCKQSGRGWLPTFETADGLAEALAAAGGLKLVATMDAETVPLRDALASRGDNADVALLVGPEGDFTAEELQAALESGAQPVSLGTLTFRSEAAAALASALVLYELGRLGPAA